MLVKLLCCVALAIPLAGQVKVFRSANEVRIDVDGKPFTSFVYGPGVRKPYFTALHSASGVLVTRHVPIDAEAGDSTDHIHQNGLWFAHGDVDGYNYWATEPSQVVAITGSQVVKSVTTTPSGFKAELDWLDPAGQPIVHQSLTISVSTEGKVCKLDFDAVLKGIRKSTFRDTKEGIFALRTATWMEQDHGGKLTCPSGETEAKCWGRRAPWVDFSGVHDGETLGIAVMQHPSGLRYPTWWHVRAYGLLAANPFGVQQFFAERVKNGWDRPGAEPPTGDFTLEPGQEARFRYRVAIHSGAVDVPELFRRYSAH
jgi:hypothetical protein